MKLSKGIRVGVSILAAAMVLSGAPHVDDRWGFIVDPPEGWQLSPSEKGVSVTDPYQVASFQVAAFPGQRFSSAVDMGEAFFSSLEAEGDVSAFAPYGGMQAILADAAFPVEGGTVRGYFVFINGEEADYILMAYAPEEVYERYHDFLLSAIDSFAPSSDWYLYPGPIGQFYYPVEGPSRTRVDVPFEGGTLAFLLDPGEEDAAQVLIEREARVLLAYGDPPSVEAWRRYYRMVVRDEYPRFRDVSAKLSERMGGGACDVPSRLLSWFQGFAFERTGTLSDLRAPISAVRRHAGDCDALALAYLIILHHLGYDGILMVSSVYRHAMAAVDVPGDGARFPFNGGTYLVAELTDDVPMGMIAQDMSTVEHWVGVDLFP
ncbi:hypothetical protein Spith_0339 [Spirochaeta thermophila DSM 6578]|uniref:Transglutaminase domain-containing protein n=1 Tax=Winmispira thermophila (strain ATCC 700085 / DSM 6578 / Z-1203) TaxID=869211 RepID=G0GDZ3_WINT7|nr:hypothetical protein [Spirochaeta thermophila]AEJ60625.1 hypothetical protein Spith_0339 [Spirochaeta thermophila DSM 6578]